MWFRYERGLKGWSPVVYHQREKPAAPERRQVTEAWPVPDDCMSDPDSPLFGELMRRFPAPEIEDAY